MSDVLARKIAVLAACLGDVIAGDDGYYAFWPTENKGAYSAQDLRDIASLIDDINKPWDAQVQADLKDSSANAND